MKKKKYLQLLKHNQDIISGKKALAKKEHKWMKGVAYSLVGKYD